MTKLLLPLLAGAAFLCGMLADVSHAADSKATVLKHVVMYKFRDDCTPEQVQQVIDAFSSMVKKIGKDTVIDFEKGLNTSNEGKSEGFTHLFVVTFRDETGLASYLKHPAHDEYVLVVKTKREKVIVFDYTTEAK